MSKAFNITLTDEAAAVMQSSTTERKKGEWLSSLILSHVPGDNADNGILERIDSRLARIERIMTSIDARLMQVEGKVGQGA